MIGYLFLSFGRSLCGSSTLLEAFNTTSCVEYLFVTREKWVAVTADFDFERLHSRANNKARATDTNCLGISEIFWVNIFLHRRILYIGFMGKQAFLSSRNTILIEIVNIRLDSSFELHDTPSIGTR
ncbi:MAG: hypothetical protein RL641_172 [Candidatus Parcubacteria bacterium]